MGYVIAIPIIPAIIFGIVWIIWIIRGIKSPPVRPIGRLLFLGGCFLMFCYYFMEFPLNAAGFWSIVDDLLPLNEAIRIIPFERLIDNCQKGYFDYYFEPYWIFYGGAALIGFSINLAMKKPMSFKKNALVAFLIPFGGFAIHAIIRLITGAMWKRADVTDIIVFMVCYAVGYGVYLLGRLLFGKRQTEKEEKN